MYRKAFMLVSGNAFGSALSLLRNLLIARMVSPEDFGIASTFAISMSIVEMFSYLGLQQLMVVDKDADDPHFQAASQGFQVMRGMISSLLLFIISGPYARFLGIEHVIWAFQVIAFVPLVNGLQHFDQHRMKRHMNFTPSVMISVLPQLASVLSLWPLAYLWADYRIMLAAIFVQAFGMVLVSHLMAERPYQLRIDKKLMRRAMIFGWPLLLNGVLLFAVFNGEKIIVGRELGMAALAVFSMSFTLTVTPTLVLANSMQSFFLPMLTRVRDNKEGFQRMGTATIEASLLIGILLILGTSLLGGPLVHVLVGKKYEAMLPILVQLAVLQAVRSSKTGSAIVALSQERTGNSIAANLPRVLSLPIAWWIVHNTGNILSIIAVSILAEVVGFGVSIWLVRTRAHLKTRSLLLQVFLYFALCFVAVADAMANPPRAKIENHLHFGLLGVAIVGIAAIASMTQLRGLIMRRWRS